jgi:hypothetical protein
MSPDTGHVKNSSLTNSFSDHLLFSIEKVHVSATLVKIASVEICIMCAPIDLVKLDTSNNTRIATSVKPIF